MLLPMTLCIMLFLFSRATILGTYLRFNICDKQKIVSVAIPLKAKETVILNKKNPKILLLVLLLRDMESAFEKGQSG